MHRLTNTTIACYALLMFAGAGPLEVLNEPAAMQTSAAATTSDAANRGPGRLLPSGANQIAATHHPVDLFRNRNEP